MKPVKEQWLDEVMNSLEGIQKAGAATDTYQRVMGRLNLGTYVAWVSGGTVWRAAAGILLVLALNIFTYVAVSGKCTGTHQAQLQAFASEYRMKGTDYNF